MLTIEEVSWDNEKETLRHIRHEVFQKEQLVSDDDEWDNKDQTAIHFLAYENHKAIACARVLSEGKTWKIGRLAVLKTYRKKGIAKQIMLHIISEAEIAKTEELLLDSQTYITAFYQSMGFTICSDEFIDAGIPHVTMKRRLSNGHT